MQLEEPGEAIKRLQRCINDVVSLLALPAIWSGGDPSRIARTLLDVLASMLHLDLVYVRLNDPSGEAPIEMVRVGQSQTRMLRPEQIGADIGRWLEDGPAAVASAGTEPRWRRRLVNSAHAAGAAR